MMLTTENRRKRSIIDIAQKTGVILENGELWNGSDRRDEDLEEGNKKKRENEAHQEKLPCDPPDFFG